MSINSFLLGMAVFYHKSIINYFVVFNMIHIAIFSYIFIMLAGIVCLSIALFLYTKIKSKLLFNFLLYFSSFTLFVFSYLVVLTYINANFRQVNFYLLLSTLAIIIISYSFLLYSIVHFVHFLVYKNPTIRRNIVEVLIGLTALVSFLSSLRIIWKEELVYQVSNLGLILSVALLVIVIGYSTLLKVIHMRDIAEGRRQILKSTLVMNILFFPGFVLDLYLLKSYNYSVFIPVFYLCSSILFLRLFLKKYSDRLTTIQSLNKIIDYSDYLSQAGISKREMEIVHLIMKGYSNRKIANQLYISISTVKSHIKNIFQKLNLKSRFEIITRLSGTLQNNS